MPGAASGRLEDCSMLANTARMTKTLAVPDQDALKRVGAKVRQRLEGDPQAYKIPTDMAEIYAIGDFLSAEECTRLTRMIDAVARPSELH